MQEKMIPDAEHWDRLQELFHLLSDTPPADRDRILNESGAAPELCSRVRALLRAGERKDLPRHGTPAAGQPPVRRIGPYVVIRLIGSGGMGSVYLGERDAAGVRQRAAIKMLAPHAGGAFFVDRFHKEQHILASLDHPHITRMLDAGLDDQEQPYLVMEYVEGQPLDAFCDDRRLSVDERLRLFVAICEAVDYAHRSLVVHLDLKPSNVLVAHDGTPKLLDFGTSKLLTAGGQSTTTISATPSYASPEQLRSEAVTTACDIYSLGVILYELLAGRRPTADMSIIAVMERAIKGVEAPKLNEVVTKQAAERRSATEGRLRSLLSGDLATIVAKCLRHAPRERYASVAALSADVVRYLEGRPVLAQRQTTLYHFTRFVGRNRGKVTAAMAALLALMASLGYAGWQQHQAFGQGQRALRMQTFLYRLFQIVELNDNGKSAATVQDFLRLGVKALPEYISNPADLRQAQLSLAEAMYQIRDYDSALPALQKVIASAKAAGDVPTEAEATAYAGSAEFLEGNTRPGLQLTARALELSRARGVSAQTRVLSAIFYAANRENLGQHTPENVKLLELAVKESRENHLPPHETGEALMQLGGVLENAGRLDEAQALFEEALRVNRQDPLGTCEQSDLLGWLAEVRFNRMQPQAALPFYQQSYERYRQCAGPEDPGTLSEGVYWAGGLIATGHANEAIRMLEKALPVWQKVYGPDHFRMMEIYYFLSYAYNEAGRYQDAERAARQQIAVEQGTLPPQDRTFGLAHFMLARALVGQHRYREALPYAESAAWILSRKAVSPWAKALVVKTQTLVAEIHRNLPAG
jgi:eukaryotic-like serine/threonine-protein kinase